MKTGVRVDFSPSIFGADIPAGKSRLWPRFYFRAFLHNHWVGAAVFTGIALHYALSGP